MKLCEECKHCRPDFYYAGGFTTLPDYRLARCALTDVITKGGRCGEYCKSMRRIDGKCGEEGSLFEEKPAPPAPPVIVQVETFEKRRRWWFWP